MTNSTGCLVGAETLKTRALLTGSASAVTIIAGIFLTAILARFSRALLRTSFNRIAIGICFLQIIQAIQKGFFAMLTYNYAEKQDKGLPGPVCDASAIVDQFLDNTIQCMTLMFFLSLIFARPYQRIAICVLLSIGSGIATTAVMFFVMHKAHTGKGSTFGQEMSWCWIPTRHAMDKDRWNISDDNLFYLQLGCSYAWPVAQFFVAWISFFKLKCCNVVMERTQRQVKSRHFLVVYFRLFGLIATTVCCYSVGAFIRHRTALTWPNDVAAFILPLSGTLDLIVVLGTERMLNPCRPSIAEDGFASVVLVLYGEQDNDFSPLIGDDAASIPGTLQRSSTVTDRSRTDDGRTSEAAFLSRNARSSMRAFNDDLQGGKHRMR